MKGNITGHQDQLDRVDRPVMRAYLYTRLHISFRPFDYVGADLLGSARRVIINTAICAVGSGV
jgi:hypothetical protein